jgi:translation initiation factor 2B subunit (eIF-2B alpha/beta/delta family)
MLDTLVSLLGTSAIMLDTLVSLLGTSLLAHAFTSNNSSLRRCCAQYKLRGQFSILENRHQGLLSCLRVEIITHPHVHEPCFIGQLSCVTFAAISPIVWTVC